MCAHLIFVLLENKMTLFQLLEGLLPPRPTFIMPQGEQVEEVDLHDYDPNSRSGSSGRQEAYASDDDDHHHGGGIQCASQ